MSYPEKLDTKESISTLLSKKEFSILKKDDTFVKKEQKHPYYITTKGDGYIDAVQLLTNQIFVKSFINPNTPYKRLLLKHGVGVGKTLAALSCAKNFIDLYKELDNMRGEIIKREGEELVIPWIFVIGFTKENIRNEILKFTYLGFVSISERAKLQKLEKDRDKNAYTRALYNEMIIKLKRRQTDRRLGGYFRFYGYQELVNRLLSEDPPEGIDEKDLVKIQGATKTGTTSEFYIREEFLRQFDNSLIICDEIHNAYNTLEKNNYGAALQYIFDNASNVRALLLSATPVNNSPSEVIDLLNLLTSKNLKKEDYFAGQLLKPHSASKIGLESRGFVSFVQNTDRTAFPTRKFVGEKLPGISYLRFIRCPMSPLHQRLYDSAQKDSNVEVDEDFESFNIYDTYSLKDIVFPAKNKLGAVIRYSESIGFIIDENRVKKIPEGSVLTGPFMKKSNIRKYSEKYYKLLDMMDNIHGEKILIYHNFVRGSGVLFLHEILLENGYLNETMPPAENTKCALCQDTMGTHKKSANHPFSPARVLMIHGELSKINMNRYKSLYNAHNNTNGSRFKVMIASRTFREGHETMAVRHCFILSLPFNIPILIQVIGRTIRKGSHLALPPNKQEVNVYIMTSSIRGRPKEYSAEEQSYVKKVNTYKIIQEIDREININAINETIFRDEEFMEKEAKKDEFINLYFKSLPIKRSITPSQITFNAHGYHKDEICVTSLIINELFKSIRPVWTYEQLIKTIRNPPFHIEYDTKKISQENIAISLGSFISDVFTLKSMNYMQFTPDKTIISGDTLHRIVRFGKYYISIPFIKNRFYIRYDIFNRSKFDRKEIHIPNTRIEKQLEKKVFQQELDNYIRDLNPKKLQTVWSIKNRYFYDILKSRRRELESEIPEWLFKYFDTLRKSPYKGKNKSVHGFYDEQSLAFKIILDSDVEQHKENRRLIEKGMVCTTYTKSKILNIAKRLSIKLSDIEDNEIVEKKDTISNYCEAIENTLLQKDLEVRKSGGNTHFIRYYYE